MEGLWLALGFPNPSSSGDGRTLGCTGEGRPEEEAMERRGFWKLRGAGGERERERERERGWTGGMEKSGKRESGRRCRGSV